MSENLYLLTLLLAFGTTVLIFALKYGAAAYQARTRADGEATYREFARASLTKQAETAASLAAMQAELAQISTRLATVSKILQEVE